MSNNEKKSARIFRRKSIAVFLISFAMVGCVRYSYELSNAAIADNGEEKYFINTVEWQPNSQKSFSGATPEDQKKIDKLRSYGYGRDKIEKSGLGIRFAEDKDIPATVNAQTLVSAMEADGAYNCLHSDCSDIRVMPLKVSCVEDRGAEKGNGLVALFTLCTLGIVPYHSSITATYNVTVVGPESSQNGDFEIVKDEWSGWFAPLLASGVYTNHTRSAKNGYCPGELVSIGLARKTLELARTLDYDAYVARQKELRIGEIGETRDETMLASLVQTEEDVDIRVAAEQRLKEIAEKKALEQRRRDEVKAEVATFEENQEWDKIIALCDKEIPNTDFLDARELKEIKEAAERSKELNRLEKIKSELDHLLDIGQWKVVLERCEQEFSDKGSAVADIIVDIKTRAEEARQKAIADREARKESIINGLSEKYVGLETSELVPELLAVKKALADDNKTNSVDYLRADIVFISKISLPFWESLAQSHAEFKRVLSSAGYRVGNPMYGKNDKLRLLYVEYHGTAYRYPYGDVEVVKSGSLEVIYFGEGQFSYPKWMNLNDAREIWNHYDRKEYIDADKKVSEFRKKLDDRLDELLMLEHKAQIESGM